jgi:hypothetical protein
VRYQVALASKLKDYQVIRSFNAMMQKILAQKLDISVAIKFGFNHDRYFLIT